MKKGLAIAAMVAMLAAAPVMAEDTAAIGANVQEETVIEWNDMVQQSFIDDGFAGTMCNIDALNMELVIPEGMEQRQPTDEEKAKSDILVFENADQTQRIEFVLGPLGDCQNLDDVINLLGQSYPGITVTPARINEYDTLVFGSEEADSMTVLISAGESGFLRIIFHPISDPTLNKLFTYVMASVQQMK